MGFRVWGLGFRGVAFIRKGAPSTFISIMGYYGVLWGSHGPGNRVSVPGSGLGVLRLIV